MVVCQPEMAVVEKVFPLAADGLGQNAIQTRLFRKGVPSPSSPSYWEGRMIKKIVYNDAYRPHTFEEISALLAPEVAAGANRLRAGRQGRASLQEVADVQVATQGRVDRCARPHPYSSLVEMARSAMDGRWGARGST